MSRQVSDLPENALDTTLKREELARESHTLKTPEARDGYLLANIYRRTGEFENAIRAYRRLIALEPDFAYAHYYLGFAHYKEGEFEEAQQALEQAIQLAAHHSNFHFTLGLLLYDMRNFEEALASFSRAIDLKPSLVEAIRHRGQTHSRLGEPGKAQQDYERVLEIEPDRLDDMHRLGTIYLQLRKWEEAESLFQRCLGTDAEDADAHYYLGEIALVYEHWEQAIAHFEKAIAIDPTHPEARLRVAHVYAKHRSMSVRNQQQFRDKAIEHLCHLIEAYREFPEFFDSMDQTYFLLGSLYDDDPNDVEKAITAYQTGLQYTNSAAAHNNLGVLYWGKNRLDEASRQFRMAIQLDPDYDSAYCNLAKLYFYRQDEQMMRDFEAWTYHQHPNAAKILYELSLALIDVARSEAYQGLYSRLHQIKNLMGISGAKMRAAQRLMDDPEQLEQQLAAAFDETQNCYDDMVQLLQSLKQEELLFEFLDLNRVLSSLAEYLSSTFRVHQVECELSLADELPLVKADPTQLKEAFHNLVLNAVDAMAGGGKLCIESSYDSDRSEVVVHLHDTGSGIPASQRQEVFRPGYSTKPQGSGFGLSIVQRTILAHHGKISLESEEGTGSTFSICLPVDMDETPTYTTLQMRPILYEAPDDLVADEAFI